MTTKSIIGLQEYRSQWVKVFWWQNLFFFMKSFHLVKVICMWFATHCTKFIENWHSNRRFSNRTMSALVSLPWTNGWFTETHRLSFLLREENSAYLHKPVLYNLTIFIAAPRLKMLWKRHFFELEDDEEKIKLEKLYLFAKAAVYTCTVNDCIYHLNR